MPPDDSCIRCGYALAGLPADALCPECAYPAARSRDRTRLLRSAHQPWLATTSRGLRDLSLALYTLVIGFAAIILLAIAEDLFNIGLGATSRGGAANFLVMLVALAATILHIRGCIRLALPTHPDYALPMHARWIIAICGSLLPLSVGAGFAFNAWFLSHPDATRAFTLLAQANAFAFLFAMQVATRHFEERTIAWSAEIERRQRGARRNLVIFMVILLLLYWSGRRGIAPSAGDFGIILIGLAYLFFSAAISRTRHAIEVERKVAERDELRQSPPQTPTSLGGVRS